MKKKMKTLIMKYQILLSIFVLVSANADAAITTYTDRTSFEAAAGAITFEDFESFVVDAPFHTSAVDVGDFTLSMTGLPSTAYNFIDIAPPETPETNVNGSTNMRVFTDDSPLSNLIFEFDTAMTAFGADFRSINDTIVRTQLIVGSDIVALPVAASSGLFSFFGFSSDIAFTSITFEGLANDVYGIDNVSYSIPEPATVLLLGLGGLGLLRRRKSA